MRDEEVPCCDCKAWNKRRESNVAWDGLVLSTVITGGGYEWEADFVHNMKETASSDIMEKNLGCIYV